MARDNRATYGSSGGGAELTVLKERVAWASMLVQARISSRWEKSVRRAYTTHVYARRDGRALELDLYLPDVRDGSAPLIVWFHGGAWKTGSRADIAPLAMSQVGRGHALASVSYTLTSDATWPVQAHEIKAAVRWLRGHSGDLGLDPDRFVAWGLSSGAHLASIVGVTGDRELEGEVGLTEGSSAVQGVIAW